MPGAHPARYLSTECVKADEIEYRSHGKQLGQACPPLHVVYCSAFLGVILLRRDNTSSEVAKYGWRFSLP
nr:hypothetical protein JVH1_8386 [Rhodococcus sp. JVH1]